MSLIDTATFIRVFGLCGLVWSIGILRHTHTLPCGSLWFHVEHWLPVDSLWITQGFLWIKGHGEGSRDTLDLVVPSGIQKRVKLGYMYKSCEYL